MTSMAVAAKHIDMSETNFKTLIHKGVFERAARGDYKLDVVRKNYIRYLRSRKSGDEGGGPSTLSDARARVAIARAESAERDNAEKKGEWCLVKEALETLFAYLMTVRENFLGMPGKLADALAMVERDVAYLVVKDEVYDCLDRIANVMDAVRVAIESIEHAGGRPLLLETLKQFEARQKEVEAWENRQ